MIDMDSRVITLGTSPAGAVLNVATARQTLIHLLGHLADEAFPRGEKVKYFDTAGRPLGLHVERNRVGIAFEAAGGEAIGERALKERVRSVMVEKQERAITLSSSSGLEPPKIPVDMPWDEQLEELSVLLNGSRDRRGFLHNLFVHGGNP